MRSLHALEVAPSTGAAWSSGGSGGLLDLHEDRGDAAGGSPDGHVAFFINVP